MKNFFITLTITLLKILPGARAQIVLTGVTKAGTSSSSTYIPYSPTVHVGGKTTAASFDKTIALSVQAYPDQVACINYACSIWEAILTTDVPITILFDYASPPLPTQVLASTSINHFEENFSLGAPGFQLNTEYSLCLANKMANTRISTAPGGYDITVNINQFEDWCTNLHGGCPSTDYDMVTTLVHEIGHGLGMLTGTKYQSGDIYYDRYADNPAIIGLDPVIYDRFVSLSGGPIPSYTTGSASLTADVEAGPAIWNGSEAMHLYDPWPFEESSSISHTSSLYYSFLDLFDDTQLRQQAIHIPSPGDLKMLEDIGWDCTGALGLEDNIKIVDFSISGSPLSPTKIINVGDAGGYSVYFDDEPPYGDTWGTSVNWTFTACAESGDVTIATGTGGLSFTMPDLPTGYVWKRDVNGRVKGYISVTGYDLPHHYPHSDKIDIGINYAPGAVSVKGSNISAYSFYRCDMEKISFYAPGADHYEVSIQHPSVSSSWSTSVLPAGVNCNVYTGLDEMSSYQFQVVAVNSNGTSTSAIVYRNACMHKMVVIPNPFSGNGTLTLSSDEAYLFGDATIASVQNPDINFSVQFDGSSSQVTIDLAQYQLPSGVYVVTAHDINGNVTTTEIQTNY